MFNGGATYAGTALLANQARVRVTFLDPATITTATTDVIIARQIQTYVMCRAANSIFVLH